MAGELRSRGVEGVPDDTEVAVRDFGGLVFGNEVVLAKFPIVRPEML